MTELGWTQQDITAAETLTQGEAPTDSLNARLKGWLGILISDPEFLKERDELREMWADLVVDTNDDRTGTLRLPLRRTRLIPMGGIGDVPVIAPSPDMQEFIGQFDHFCDRWALSGIETWELPSPQGPALPATSDLQAWQTPGQHQSILLSKNIAPIVNDRLHEKLDDARVAEAKSDPKARERLDAMRHWESFGHLFEIAHYEAAIFARYPRRKGSISLLQRALASHLGLRVDRILKLRKALAACRRGERPEWLR